MRATHARVWPAALALFFGVALASASGASAQTAGSKAQVGQPGFPTGEQALLGTSARLTIQAVPAAPTVIAGPQALMHRFGSRPTAEPRDTGVRKTVCGEMALLHRHTPRGRTP